MEDDFNFLMKLFLHGGKKRSPFPINLHCFKGLPLDDNYKTSWLSCKPLNINAAQALNTHCLKRRGLQLMAVFGRI